MSTSRSSTPPAGSLAPPVAVAKTKLRRHLRQMRRALPPQQQQNHSTRLLHQTLQSLLFLRFRRFALYLPADGEIDTWPLVNKLWSFGLQVGLPCLQRSSQGRLEMSFARYTQQTPLVRGYYNLLEPLPGALQQPAFLPDVLLMPLVGFDSFGHRLGMGGGFYDGYANPLERAKPALRIGLAHELQGLPANERLLVDSWDKPLDGVITEQRRQGFTARGRLCLKGGGQS